MKTVITIVIDEEKEWYNWRCERNADDNLLVENFRKQLADVKVQIKDSLERGEKVNGSVGATMETVAKELKEQMKEFGYNLYCPEDDTVGVL